MKYISIDIETSGLDPVNNQVLSIGAIVEDTQLKLPWDEIPKFNAIVLQRQITGSPRALDMNKGIIQLMGEYLDGDTEIRAKHDKYSGSIFCDPEDVVKEFYKFLMIYHEGKKEPYDCPINSNTKHILINVAGKNFGTFDQVFLQKLPWWQKLIRVRQRIFDPAILCMDWDNDEELPSLTKCKERLHVDGITSHEALKDAWDVVQVLRKFYYFK